jgi:hypothetical protein
MRARLKGYSEDFDGREYWEEWWILRLLQLLKFFRAYGHSVSAGNFEMIRSQLILRKRDDAIMIKVPKESSPAYHFSQAAAFVLEPAYFSLGFAKVLPGYCTLI